MSAYRRHRATDWERSAVTAHTRYCVEMRSLLALLILCAAFPGPFAQRQHKGNSLSVSSGIEWKASEYPNPEREFRRCHRPDWSLLCDPDDVLSPEQGMMPPHNPHSPLSSPEYRVPAGGDGQHHCLPLPRVSRAAERRPQGGDRTGGPHLRGVQVSGDSHANAVQRAEQSASSQAAIMISEARNQLTLAWETFSPCQTNCKGSGC